MKADAITTRILDDAREEASQLMKEASDRVDRIRRENERNIAQMRDIAMEKAKADGVEARDRMLRMAELDERKELLSMKRQVIGQAFDKALDEMRAMPAQQAQAFMKGQLLSAAAGDEEIILSKADRATFDDAYVASVNQALTAAGKPGKLKLSAESRELGGGMVLRRGGMEINLTYRAVLDEIRPALEAQVAAMLFDEKESR